MALVAFLALVLIAVGMQVFLEPIGAFRWLIPVAVVWVALRIANHVERRWRLIRSARTLLLARENGWDYERDALYLFTPTLSRYSSTSPATVALKSSTTD